MNEAQKQAEALEKFIENLDFSSEKDLETLKKLNEIIGSMVEIAEVVNNESK